MSARKAVGVPAPAGTAEKRSLLSRLGARVLVPRRAEGALATGKAFFKEYREDDLSGLAAELTYRFFLAIFPFLLFLAALGGIVANAANVSDPTGQFLDLFGDALPADAASVVRGQVEAVVEHPNGGVLSLALVGALWTASGGAAACIKALNRTYDVEETRPLLVRTGLGLLLTVLAAAAIIAGLVSVIGLQYYSVEVAGWFGLGDTTAFLLELARWPLAALAVSVAAGLLYWGAPNRRHGLRDVAPGAAAFALTWLAASALFAVYVTNFGSYNKTYGTLGGVVALLVWLYVTSLVLVSGGELNAVLADRRRAVTALPAVREHPSVAAVPRTAGMRAPRPPRERATRPIIGILVVAATLALGLIPALRRQYTGERAHGD